MEIHVDTEKREVERRIESNVHAVVKSVHVVKRRDNTQGIFYKSLHITKIILQHKIGFEICGAVEKGKTILFPPRGHETVGQNREEKMTNRSVMQSYAGVQRIHIHGLHMLILRVSW